MLTSLKRSICHASTSLMGRFDIPKYEMKCSLALQLLVQVFLRHCSRTRVDYCCEYRNLLLCFVDSVHQGPEIFMFIQYCSHKLKLPGLPANITCFYHISLFVSCTFYFARKCTSVEHVIISRFCAAVRKYSGTP